MRWVLRWSEGEAGDGEVEEPWREEGGRVAACLGGSGRGRGESMGRLVGSQVAGGRMLPSSGPGPLSGQTWDKTGLDKVDRCKGQRLMRGGEVHTGSKGSTGRWPGSQAPSPGLPLRWGEEEGEPWQVGRGRW